MLARIKALFNKLSNYPRLRILLIVALVIIVVIFLMNIVSPKVSPSPPPSQVQAVAPNPSSPVEHVSASAAQQYNQLQSVNQQQELKSAVSSGNSIFENSFNAANSKTQTTTPPQKLQQDTNATQQADADTANNNANTTSSSDANTDQNNATNSVTPKSPEQVATADQAKNTENTQLQQQLNALQQQLQQQTAQAQDSQIANSEGNMRSAATDLTSSWSLPTATTVEAAAPTSSSSTTSTAGPVLIKAGTILFGTIDTALDSDQPGTPVMATIVNGPYQGAKLLGAFQAENDALVVQFNTMSIPSLSQTISINAYALDQNTADNAIATSVDNHYLLRYGMLFASAFLQGFGNAYINYNYTCPPNSANCTLINSTGVPNSTATTTTAAYQGLGQVGTALSQAAAQMFNTPPTIKVDQGTGIGVLFMDDVTLSSTGSTTSSTGTAGTTTAATNSTTNTTNSTTN